MSEDEQGTVPDTFKSKKALDFFSIKEREAGGKKPVLEVYPDYRVMRSKDLMIRAKSFYAIWDDPKGLWSTDEFDVQRLVDEALKEYQTTTTGFFQVSRKFLGNFSSNSWLQFRNYVGHLSDNHKELDATLTFRNTEVKKEDYVSKRLPYDLAPGDISAWDEIVGTLYDAENRAKIEWAIGAIVTGDSKTIQKFLVFYGAQGTGKSTILNIIQWMFEGYWTSFVARDLVGPNNSFALEAFKTNPLIAIEHDGDLSKVQDNSKLNSLVAHEHMEINEKNKPKYMMRFVAMLLIGTNTPVKITDSKSGLIRRLIDIHPTGNLISPGKYQSLMNQIHFELGAIAYHCKEVYLSMGKDYYSGYKPVEMMLQTDVFFNYIESHYDIFKAQNGTTLKQAFELWKVWTTESEIEWKMPQYKFREELRNYFDTFEDRAVVNDERVRSWYGGFKADKFKTETGKSTEQHMYKLVMEETESLLDKRYSKYPAQYAKDDGTPRKYWNSEVRTDSNGKEFIPKASQIVDTKLNDLDTSKEHYVKVPEQEIVIDFDLKDANGKKSAERNLEAASSWPSTYAEFSKSGEGIHLHYFYDGDVSELQREYDEGIEIKVYRGNSSLRRRLTRCNAVAVATLVPGQLPVKENPTTVIDVEKIQDEKHLRALINKALRKDVNPGTKSNVDFIHKCLEDAYKQGISYDVTDMKPRIIAFAGTSSNQSIAAFKIVKTMKFASEDQLDKIKNGDVPETFRSQRSLNADKEVIFDVEVFPNLFVVCWKYKGAPEDSVVSLVNPTPQQIENLLPMKLVGFNNRKYDNHILYGALQGFTNMDLYHLSKRIIENRPGATFGQAYNLSYTDIYDFSQKRQSLKLWQNELGIHHQELGFDWDKPVPEELWHKVEEYCKNDVNTTDAVREHLEPDFIARQILADLSGLSMNSTTQQHTARIVFGEDKHPQHEFVYTDLSEEFPGYSFQFNPDKKQMESTYKGEVTGEGGLVRAKPGMYENVAVLDIASMHPTTIEQLNLFGDYTQKFAELKAARVAIKRKNFDAAREMLGGKLARHLNDESQAEALAGALKLAVNIVYGLTSASFDNSFRDPRNLDNIVAKRGALFMVELMLAVEHQGFEVIHIKTDSIKIPNATPEIIKFVFEFGAKYGYEFEHEATYSRFCLVNDAVYIAKVGWAAKEKKIGKWEAVGAQFQHPYVFKYLFSGEEITFDDMTESKSVQVGAQYLDFTGLDDTPMVFLENLNDEQMKFIGKHGRYVPMLPGTGGGFLLRINDEGKQFAVTGTKGFQWQEAEIVRSMGRESDIDGAYFEKLITKAIDDINKFGDFEWFVHDVERAEALSYDRAA